MEHKEQVEQARKLLAYLQSRTTAMAHDVYRNPVREYVCPRQLAQERELFFRRSPFLVGLSCLFPHQGITLRMIILVRRFFWCANQMGHCELF